MAIQSELYNQPIRGYWENKKTRAIYLLFQGNSYDNPVTKERTHWNASAINLRTGKLRGLRLKDFANLQRVDSETEIILGRNISVEHFVYQFI
ncbi:MAG: hypothetical protein PHF67_01590 [Candidatus Nanoarchaeia archaeon]|nr:hypothetical protein [Candidatus Nanoarchaeia archaeon]